MKLRNKKLTTIIGLTLGVTTLAGAAFASYSTSNGYEVGKNAVKGLLENENYTMDFSMCLLIDGEQYAKEEVNELYDRGGNVKLNRIYKTESLYGCDTATKSYIQDNDYIGVYNWNNKEEVSVYKDGAYMTGGSLDLMNEMTDEKDRNTVQKVVRFAELAADTFVGDLKNNIVCVSDEDDKKVYEMNLDAVQIPEIVNAGLSAIFSSVAQNEYNKDDPLMALGTDPIVKNALLRFAVDNEGRLTEVSASGSMIGDGHEASLEAEIKIYDYGATKPERVDISKVKDVGYVETAQRVYTIDVEESEVN